MTEKNTKAKNAKPYHTPKLEVHGELSTLTQQAGSGGVFTTFFGPTPAP